MSLSSHQVETLGALLDDLRTSKLPIDNPKIERILIALLEAAVSSGPEAAHANRQGAGCNA